MECVGVLTPEYEELGVYSILGTTLVLPPTPIGEFWKKDFCFPLVAGLKVPILAIVFELFIGDPVSGTPLGRTLRSSVTVNGSLAKRGKTFEVS